MNDMLEVLLAADGLIEAFARHDRQAYFAAFSPDASFVFHSAPDALNSRAAYESVWDSWERELGFQVRGCHSSQRRVQLLGDVAIFTHTVDTTIATHEGEAELQERETIVFRRGPDQVWLATHEHLSPRPPLIE
jgi:uncharacterized protein (TIGR02246 family)